MKTYRRVLLPLLALPVLALATPTEKPVAPFVNSYLADSTYPVIHAGSDFTPLAGPVGPSRRLRTDESRWKPIGPMSGAVPIYSGPYPNGKRVIWIGGYDRVAKLDADTLEVLATYAIGGTKYFGEDEIRRYIAAMDKMEDKSLFDYSFNIWAEAYRDICANYRLLSRDNELYMPHRAPDGSISLQVYGEADTADPASTIQFRREWKIPPELSRATLMSVNMTSDGEIVMVTMDGVMIALSRDFTTHHVLKLPSEKGQGDTKDFFAAFVRNGLTTDDHGGIYVVTRENLHRVQWTGKELSLDEADGAWSVPYPNEMGIGSGTSPALMGWGPKEDHLVVIADGTKGNNMMAFWRDKIPDDWKALPGMDRRVAGSTPVHFGVSKDEQAQIENALIVYGYGAFINTSYPETRFLDQKTPSRQWLSNTFYTYLPGHGIRGGTMIRWDPQARVLKTAWQSQTNFDSAVCTVSGATEIVYCWGARNREWTLEGTDWNTGKSAFTYTLGRSHRFNALGGMIIIAPNGAVDCGCAGGMGIVRVKPHAKPGKH